MNKNSSEDEHLKKLISNSVKLSNVLLANEVNHRINEKRRKTARINVSSEFMNYKNQIENLK